MNKRLLSVGAITTISICMLTGCNTKNAYENDVQEFEDCADNAKQTIEHSSDYEEYLNNLIDILDDAKIKTKEGKEFKENALEFLNDYSKIITTGIKRSDRDEVLDSFDDVHDLFLDFLDAAEDKDVDIDDLEDTCNEIANSID